MEGKKRDDTGYYSKPLNVDIAIVSEKAGGMIKQGFS
jgi:hypothetical protein